jgi:hypothetical protein
MTGHRGVFIFLFGLPSRSVKGTIVQAIMSLRPLPALQKLTGDKPQVGDEVSEAN